MYTASAISLKGSLTMKAGIKAMYIPVPKKGDLSDPNKWQEIMLMDMCSKLFSLVMRARTFTLLDKHGTRFQFGGTPGVGCRDGLFALKALLNAWHNHDLASYAGFVNLVKAYNTAITSYWLTSCVDTEPLLNLQLPQRQSTATTHACWRLKTRSKKIPQNVRVRQGDNMAPVLFLFLLTAFAQTLELKWCDNILSGYLCAVTTVFSQQDGIYGFKFLKRFLEISSSEISLFSRS
jgi:hypothetical protein